MCRYKIGSTIKKGIKTANMEESIQSSVNITKEATGTALITLMGSQRSIFTGSQQWEATAKDTPAAKPDRKPAPMRRKEESTQIQKLLDGSSSVTSTVNTCMGAGRNNSFPICLAATCQSSSQNREARE